MLKHNLVFPCSWHVWDQSFYPDRDKERKKKKLLRRLAVTYSNPTSHKFNMYTSMSRASQLLWVVNCCLLVCSPEDLMEWTSRGKKTVFLAIKEVMSINLCHHTRTKCVQPSGNFEESFGLSYAVQHRDKLYNQRCWIRDPKDRLYLGTLVSTTKYCLTSPRSCRPAQLLTP